ncbi:MAG: LPS export ABC transporter periplasmic protein LptC [Rhodanobacter sp.]
MSLRGYLRDRRIPAAIVMVGLATAASQLLYWWVAPSPKVSDFVGPPRSGYTLTNFKMWSYDVDGLPSFRMTAPHLERREGDESLYINTPKFDMPSKQPGVPDWDGNSLYGWVNQKGTLLKLQGPVYMHRPAYTDVTGAINPVATMHTSEITAWPKENRMETAEPATMTQGDSKMSGIGMRANLNDNHLELLHDVHGILIPRKRNAPAQPSHAQPAGSAAGARETG